MKYIDLVNNKYYDTEQSTLKVTRMVDTAPQGGQPVYFEKSVYKSTVSGTYWSLKRAAGAPTAGYQLDKAFDLGNEADVAELEAHLLAGGCVADLQVVETFGETYQALTLG